MRIASFLNSFLRHISIAGAALLAVSPAALLAQGNSPSAADGFDPNVNGVVYATAIQPDGKILLAGNFTLLKPNGTVGAFRNNVARINADGSLDATFDPNVNGPVNALFLMSDGRILIGGSFTTLQPNGAATTASRSNLARLKSDGTLDPTFDPSATNQLFNPVSAKTQINALVVQSWDGKILLGGQFTARQLSNGADDPTTRNYLVRLNADGSLDTAFNPKPNGVVLTLAVKSSDKTILVGGGFTTLQPNGAATATTCNYLARLNTDGTVDSSFAPSPNAGVTIVALQSDGRILAGGYFSTFQPNGADTAINHSFFVRLNTDGTIDTTFTNTNANSKVLAVAIQPDGKVLIGGSFSAITPGNASSMFSHAFCARLNPDGTLDDDFNPGPDYTVDTIALQPDGKVLIGGNFTQLKPNSAFVAANRNHLARLNADGSLDANLDPNASSRIQAMAVQADGKILFGGLTFTSVGGQTRNGVVRLNTDGTLDAAFNPNANGRVLAIAVQPSDQKIIVAGSFTSIGGATYNYIARLNTDGSVDSTFNPNPNNQVYALAIQPDGKILVGGSFSFFTASDATTTSRNNVARLNTDGTLDTNFDPGADSTVSALVLQSDGKILIGGYFGNFYTNGGVIGTARSSLARLNTDGTVDAGFTAHANSAVTAIVAQTDGKIVAGGLFTQVFASGATAATDRHGIARFNSDGTLDATFDPCTNQQVVAMALQSDGKIILGGLFTTLQPNGAANWTQRNYIARVNTDGSLDTTFDPNPNGQVRALIVQASGKILVAGGFSALQPLGGTPVTVSLPIARLNANGTVDTGFFVSAGGPAGSQVNALVVQPNGRVLAGGSFTTLAGATSSNLARFNADNSADNSFNPAPDGPVNAMAVLSDNAGTVSQLQGFAWLDRSGALLPSFKPGANVQLQGQINAIAVQPTGQIIMGGSFTNQSGATGDHLVRFNADGTLDTSFSPAPDGAIYAVMVRADTGQIIVAGGFQNICGTPRNHIAQLNTDGSLDTVFDPNANNLISTLLQQADGKILIGGAFTTVQPNAATTTTTRNYLARLNTDGTVDAAFDPNPGNLVYAMALQSDGKILLGGIFATFMPNGATTTTKRVCIARVNSDGTLDPGFDPNGSGSVLSLVVQPDGMILVGGNFTTIGGWTRDGIARLQTNGNLDEKFDPETGGPVNQVALQSDGSILLGGAFTSVGGVTRNRLARLSASGSLDLIFDPNPNDQINALVVRTDGSMLVGGFFTAFRAGGTMLVGGAFANIGGVSASNLALLRDDGTVASSFQANPNGKVNALLLQPDGKTVVGGDFTRIAGVARNRLARFNADGTLDPTFNPAGPLGAVTALTLQADGKIVAGAPFTSGVPTYASLARLGADGTLDPAFQPGLLGAITALAVQPDGRVLVADAAQASGVPAQPGRVARLNADGSRDTGFNAYANGRIATLALQTDGRIVLGGVFTTVNGVARNRLARLNADGTLDTDFDPNADNSVYSLAIQSDGKVLVGGAFSLVSNQGRNLLARIAATSPAAQSLTLSADRTTITWTRTGTGPELSSAVFDQTADGGATWTRLGTASRVSGTSNWRLGGLSVSGSLVYVRARGIVLISQYGSADIIELFWQFSLSTTSGLDYVGVAADLAGNTAGNGTTAVSTTATAFGTTLSASSITAAGTGAQQSDAAATAGRLISLSARATVSAGYPLITGFVIGGSGQKSVLLRAVGPGLSGLGVPATLAAPRMQINNATGQDLLDVNTGWSGASSSLTPVFNRLGAFPLKAGSADAATLITLSPGSYTVTIPDGQGSGTVLAEVYDADDSTSTGAVRFTGLSARGQVTVGDPLIAGLAVSGNTSRRVLLRGSGPALAKYSVSGVLSDPVLAVYDSQDQLLAQNDNWQTQTAVNPAQTIGNVADVVAACASVFASGSNDSALIITLAPGTYTVQISGVNHSAGAAMVEAYDLGP
jgi:uncharacterized delta-60 repeat protein